MASLQIATENPTARRFSQVCVVALATLISSGTGLLAYIHQDSGPVWLKALVLVSAAVVTLSFGGWLIASLTAYARGRFTSR